MNSADTAPRARGFTAIPIADPTARAGETRLDFTDSNPGPWMRAVLCEADLFLLSRTKRWLAALPKGVRPLYLPDAFPRICNGLARLWHSPVELDVYLSEKECSVRPYREGFPPLVKEELLAIRVHSLRSQMARERLFSAASA